MNFIIPLLYLLFSTGTVVYLLKEKFGKCIPISMIISTLLIFFSQILFNTFLIGYILCIIFSLICPTIIIYKRIKNEDLSEFKKNFISYGLIMFIVLYVILYVLNIGKLFNMSDEYHYWGYNVKYMLKNGTYFKTASHLPFISTFEMFMCILRGGYSESAVTFAIQLFEFSFIIPCISEYKFNDKKYNVIAKTFLGVIFIILLVLMFDFEHTASSIYTDAFMMLYLAYLIFQTSVYDFSKRSTVIIFAISIYGFVLNKQIVLVLLLIPLFSLLLNNILENRNIKNKINKNNIIKLCKAIFIYIIIPLFIIKLWNIYISESNSSTGDAVSFLSNFINILTGKKQVTYELTVVETFLKALTNRNIFSASVLNLTYVSLFFLIVLCVCLMHKYNKKFDNNKFISIVLTYIVGTIGYAFIFLVMYSFGGFNELEGQKLASYERYFSTFLMGLIVSLFMIYMYVNNSKKVMTYKTILLSLCVMCVFLPGDKYFCLLPGVFRNSSSDKALVERSQRVANSIDKYLTDEEYNILIFSNDLEGNIYIKYYSEKFNHNYDSYAYNYNYLSYEEFINKIFKYDYFIIIDSNDDIYSFLEKSTNDVLEEEKIYKIDKNNMKFTKLN